MVDWKDCKFKEVKLHNITVPVAPVFPCEQVTWFSDEATKELFRRTMDQTVFRDANAHVMFNIAKARLSLSEAYTKAREWFVTRERPNGLFEWVGHGHATYMQEMIGIAGLINELLLQDVDDKIRLFPCWPKDKDASFSGFRTRGGFIVSAEFKNGDIVSARIESVADKQLQLLSPWESIYVNGNKAVVDESGLVIINAKAGQLFQFTEKDPNASNNRETK